MLFHVSSTVVARDVAIRDLPLPESASIALVVRGSELVVARGSTVLRAGDQVYVFCRPEDRSMLSLLLGRPEIV